MHRYHFLAICLIVCMALVSCGEDDPVAPAVKMPTDGLLIHLPFTTDATDQSGNGNDGTLLGGAQASGSLVLGNNDTDMLRIPGSVMDGLGDFTFAAFLEIDTFRNESHEVISGANGNEDNALIFWYAEATNEWKIGVNNISASFLPDTTIEDGTWHHVAVTRFGPTSSLYLDGEKLGSSVLIPADTLDIHMDGLVFGQDQDVVNGGFDAAECWAGSMDNLRIYDRALSDSEIETLSGEDR